MKNNSITNGILLFIEETLFMVFAVFFLFSIKRSFHMNIWVFSIGGGIMAMFLSRYHQAIKPFLKKWWLILLADVAVFVLVMLFMLKFGDLDMSAGLKPRIS